MNPYDRCVAKKVINGKQCNISFYVNYNNKSNVYTYVVIYVINITKVRFVGIALYKGKEHTLLGMLIIFIEFKTVEIEMKDQLKTILTCLVIRYLHRHPL